MATKKYDYNRTLAEADIGYAKTKTNRNSALAKSRMKHKTSGAAQNARTAKLDLQKNKLQNIASAPSKPKKLVEIESMPSKPKKLVEIEAMPSKAKPAKKLVEIKKAVVKPSAAKRKTTKNIKK